MYDENPPRLLQIPEEILTDEILPRLPVKSLSRFKCVSKSWKYLIESNDRFIKIQYGNSAKNPRVIFDSKFYSMKDCSLQWLLNSKEGSDPTKNEERSGTIVGCSNGIVCCYEYIDGRFWLWNPAIRVSIKLPDSGGRYIAKRGFGWDESSGAYKVFAVLYDRKSTELIIGRIFSSNTKSWRTVPCGSLSLFSPSGLFLRGNLHWVDWRHSQIECFDLEREEFGRIELPLENAAMVPFHFSVLGEVDGCLSILIDLKKSLEVWVMKEFGVNDSWFKLLTFPHTALSRPRTFGCFCLFGEGPNGEILVCDEKKLTVYSPKDDAFSTTRNYVYLKRARLYVESLVSPKGILPLATW